MMRRRTNPIGAGLAPAAYVLAMTIYAVIPLGWLWLDQIRMAPIHLFGMLVVGVQLLIWHILASRPLPNAPRRTQPIRGNRRVRILDA